MDLIETEPLVNNSNILVDKRTIIKAGFINLDIFSDSLIYTWLDKNRVKFSIDGANNIFRIKKNTAFYHSKFDLPDELPTKKEIEKNGKTPLILHLEDQIKKEYQKYFEIYNILISRRKIIFYIKDKKATNEN
jgi:hypothetical protein